MAVEELQEVYYGGSKVGCPAYIDTLREDEGFDNKTHPLSDEYIRMCEIGVPVIALYSSDKCGHDLLNILKELQPEQSTLEARSLLSVEQIKAQSCNLAALRYQLPLPFDDLDIGIGRN